VFVNSACTVKLQCRSVIFVVVFLFLLDLLQSFLVTWVSSTVHFNVTSCYITSFRATSVVEIESRDL